MKSIETKRADFFYLSKGNIRNVYKHKNETIPIIVNDVNYWLDGDDPRFMPEDYFRNPASMTAYQMKKIEHHLKHIDDNYIPVLHPWYGVGVVPTALGCDYEIPAKGDLSLKSTVLKKPEDIRSFKKPDPYKDGMMPLVLETIDYMVANTPYPVCVTDTQSPLNIALSLCGVENLFVWMCTDPDYTQEIMNFCTEVLIDWIKVQKKHIGIGLNEGSWPHGIYLPDGFGGVSISDDDCTVISADLYQEFVVPYNSKVLKEFGGGTIHFCGTAMHQLENFLLTEGLTGINNFCMGNFEQVEKMQNLFEDKIALMVCDFAPLDFEKYIQDLSKILKPKGTILALFAASGFALYNGSYKVVNWNAHQKASEIYQKLKQTLNY